MTHLEKMTYLREQVGETISPTQLAKVLDGKAYTYNVLAKNGQLPFPHVWRGRNLRIFVAPLLRLLERNEL